MEEYLSTLDVFFMLIELKVIARYRCLLLHFCNHVVYKLAELGIKYILLIHGKAGLF